MKQAVLISGSFYIVQSVEDEGRYYALGAIEAQNNKNCVEFNTFFEDEAVLGSEPEFFECKDLLNFLKKEASPETLNLRFRGSEFVDYESRFNDFMNTPELKKAVLYKSYNSETDFPDLNAYLWAMKSLIEKTKDLNGYLFGFYDRKNKRALLGFSPEVLYQKNEDKHLIHAVAGTQEKNKFKPWTEKLLSEHKMVEEGIQKRLNPIKVEFSEVKTIEYGRLVHLKSVGSITADVAEKELLKLHPTSAVGTLPHKHYKTFELGPEPRGFFGGYVKVKSQTKSFAVVLIRGVEFREKRARVCVGGGVIKNSNIEEEWTELESKWIQFKALWDGKL